MEILGAKTFLLLTLYMLRLDLGAHCTHANIWDWKRCYPTYRYTILACTPNNYTTAQLKEGGKDGWREREREGETEREIDRQTYLSLRCLHSFFHCSLSSLKISLIWSAVILGLLLSRLKNTPPAVRRRLPS